MPEGPPPTIVVLDDDPTGTQTVHDVPVLTEWSVDSLRAELSRGGRCFFILTNSRALPREDARALNREIGSNLLAAADGGRRAFRVISRSDSTLRGHFPAETDALAAALGGRFDATLLIPAFFEGGRTTAADVHYVGATPVAETEFARDARFGFRHSNLRDWVEEKTAGRIPAAAVTSFALEDIRGPVAALQEKLLGLRGDAVAIVNARQFSDLERFAEAVRLAEAAHKRFIFRTAASFVAAYAGNAPRPLLQSAEFAPPGAGRGLLVVGSHVRKSSEQLRLWQEAGMGPTVWLPAGSLLSPEAPEAIRGAAAQVDQALEEGKTVALATSREFVSGQGEAEHAAVARTISHGLVRAVAGLRTRPRWLIAKGGITASDVATLGLNVKRALVLGQALPGVPLWRLGPESRWPGLAYIVFPGNVGDPNSLARLTTLLG